QLSELSTIASTRSAKKGEVLFREGDPGETLYVVMSGLVRLYKRENGRDLDIAVAGEGQYFGEMSLIDGAARSAAALAVEDAELLLVGRGEYLGLLGKCPRMLDSVLLRLTRCLRESNTHRFGLVQEKEEIKAQSELERLRSLSQMVAGVAHEMNTPLGIIRNAASLVTEWLGEDANPGPAPAATPPEAPAAAAGAARPTPPPTAAPPPAPHPGRQVADTRERVDLLQVVEETVALYRFKARAAKLAIATTCSIEPDDRTWDGFPGHLSQVLLNLLTNVDRYAYPDGSGGRVEIEVSPAGQSGAGEFSIPLRALGRPP